MNPATLRTTSSKPGIARSVFSAARSAGCSQARDEIWGRGVGMARGSWMGCNPGYDGRGWKVSGGAERRRRIRLDYVKRVLQVAQQIAHVLHSAAQADEALADAELLPMLEGDARVRHRGGMADQALDAAERLREGEHAAATEHFGGALLRVELNGDHPAEAGHLRLRELVLRVRGETGIDHALLPQALGEPGGDRAAVLVVARHAEVQRFRGPERPAGVERTRHGARGVENELQAGGEIVVVQDGDTAHHVGVAVQVLRRGVVDDVRAEVEWLLEEWRGEGVVDEEQCIGTVRDLSRRTEVGDAHQRIGRRLDEDHPRGRGHRIGDALRIARVDVAETKPEVLQQPVEQPEAPAVHVLAADHVIARSEELHDRVEAAHSRAEGEAVTPALERGDVALEGLASRVLSPRVLVPLVLAETLLDVSRGEVHGGHDGTGQRLWPLAGVDGPRGEPHVQIVVKYARHADTRPGRVVRAR